ncbi:hypothetical protein ETAA8_30350 [Anatilimnocola aggregata]|uniref:Uncharacterized protein n=1 Tax=Anatilimnocola aggregata TaxID=2528021 RepID=A0A517YCH7_9BACT|nr:hypothetical protein [Anatilimnocola aggregata]QDU27943.1 hypothetical protein ETAA8_30350 [Anatilimnocola aggregata]
MRRLSMCSYLVRSLSWLAPLAMLAFTTALLINSPVWSQEDAPKNKKKGEAKAEAKTERKKKAEPKPKPKAELKVELEYPPKLPGGQEIVTDTSPEFLKPLKELPEGVEIAKTPPTIDFAYLPEQTYAARPWSNWGESVVHDGKYYCGYGDHLAPQGNGFVVEYDPSTKKFRTLINTKKLLNMPEGHYAPGKIHSRLGVGKDGWLYCTTHRGSTTITTDQYHYKGDWIIRANPATGVQEVVQAAPVEKHCLPCAHLDPDRLIIYGGSAPGSKTDTRGIQFWAYDLANRKMIYSGPDGPARAMMVSKSTGNVYFVPGAGNEPLMRFNPKSGKAPEKIEGSLGIRAASDETPQGKIYCASQAGSSVGGCELYEFDTKTEKIRSLGLASVGTEHYVAALSAEATGKYIYYAPGAHGGGYRDGSPVVQFNTHTGKRKVIAFLHPFYQAKYGVAVHGTYAVSVTPDGSQVFICWNAARGTKGWDTVALTSIKIPASERE